MSLLVRPPAVAGMFYPSQVSELREMVQGYLDTALFSSEIPKAMIIPHAGYIYSGPIAASAYSRLFPISKKVQRVVLLGPSHRVSFTGIAASSASIFSTPLGEIPIDRESIKKILDLFPQQVQILDEAHVQEHSLEVHLPFLQESLDHFELVPLVVGDANSQEVADALSILWGGEETLIIISSDLSHFHHYEKAKQIDAQTSQFIEELNYGVLRGNHACGCRPINGLLRLAQERGMQAKTIDLRNSGDTQGSKDRVVGYGSYVFQ